MKIYRVLSQADKDSLKANNSLSNGAQVIAINPDKKVLSGQTIMEQMRNFKYFFLSLNDALAYTKKHHLESFRILVTDVPIETIMKGFTGDEYGDGCMLPETLIDPLLIDEKIKGGDFEIHNLGTVFKEWGKSKFKKNNKLGIFGYAASKGEVSVDYDASEDIEKYSESEDEITIYIREAEKI
jgi:hypothetical protein